MENNVPLEDIVVDEKDMEEELMEAAIDEGRFRDYKVIIKALFLSSLIGFSAYTLLKESKVGKIKVVPRNTEYSASDEYVLDNNGICYECKNIKNVNAKWLAYPDTLDNGVSKDVIKENVVDEVPELAEDNSLMNEFETIVADFSNENSERLASISASDITKFVAIANIDYIVENDSELAKRLYSGQKEEDLNDAGKVIGAIVMHDYNVWSSSNSTEDLIKVSNVIMGPQKEAMIKIEDYVDKIANAVNSQDSVLVNKLVREFLDDINNGELSKLDDGVGFAAETHIALIADVIAKDYLDQENFDMLQVLKSAEKYVSNIFTEYATCSNDGKILSR